MHLVDDLVRPTLLVGSFPYKTARETLSISGPALAGIATLRDRLAAGIDWQETAIRFTEELEKRGKRLGDASPEEAVDLLRKAHEATGRG